MNKISVVMTRDKSQMWCYPLVNPALGGRSRRTSAQCSLGETLFQKSETEEPLSLSLSLFFQSLFFPKNIGYTSPN
jgi:hypothetical protein